MSNKRFVIKNSKQLGFDESWISYSKRKRQPLKSHPYWYVFDKLKGVPILDSDFQDKHKIVSKDFKYRERQFAKNMADLMNDKIENNMK